MLYVCLKELFIIIMTFTVNDINSAIFHMINQSVFFIDTATVFALQIAAQSLRLANSH